MILITTVQQYFLLYHFLLFLMEGQTDYSVVMFWI